MNSSRSSDITLHQNVGHLDVPQTLSHWHLFSLRGTVTKEILTTDYDGSGTESDPYVISFIENDPGNPKLLPTWKKWTIVATVSFVTLVSAFDSSVYVGTINQVKQYFKVSNEVAILGLSLYVLGFAVGPLIWAPLGELIGRQLTHAITFVAFTAFNGAAVAAQNIQTLIIVRFFAGAFAAAPFTNSSGNLADLFDPTERSLAFGIYCVFPFLGPTLSPLVGGFLGAAAGWRWVMGLSTILSAISLVLGVVLVPETFGEVLLRRRAKTMSEITGKHYVSSIDIKKGDVSPRAVYKKALARPWAILFLEPIVLLLSLWISIVYGTLYLFLAGFPYVYERARGWSAGCSGLALLGILVGTLIAAAINIPVNKRFATKAKEGDTPPEIRLQPAMIGGIAIPLGIFWFAWTNAPSIHWSCAIIGSSFFGFGLVVVWTSVNNYIVDAYKIYAASALAGQVVLRSLFGAVFPLFTEYMYEGIGIHWASSVPGFVALACVPLPFVFHQYGARIRKKSRFATKADEATKALSEKKGSV